MIPKIIHYCWFGRNPLPELAVKCIESWKKFLPDYEIREWTEDNFDVYSIQYTKDAYEAKKYAFVSDYARFWILYKYGGIYFDTDVEVIKNMDHIVLDGAFMGYEHDPKHLQNKYGEIAPGLGLGAEAGNAFIAEIITKYKEISFFNAVGIQNPDTVVTITTNLFKNAGLRADEGVQIIKGFTIYPKDYFCPKDYITGKLNINQNTVTIHHYGASWYPWYARLEMKVCQILGIKYRDFLHRNVPKLQLLFKLARR